MWHNQTLFRVSAQLAAEGIFSGLDRNLKPEVSIAAFGQTGKKGNYTLILDPSEINFDFEHFQPFIFQVAKFEKEEAERYKDSGHLSENERHERIVQQQLLRKNLQVLLNELNLEKESNRLSFCACPVWINDMLVFVTLHFDRNIFLSHYVLPPVPERQTHTPAISFLDATVTEFLNDCVKALHETEFASGKSILDRDYSEVLRAAGKRFMYTPAGSSHGLFDACNAISALKYEGSEGVGSMLLAKRNHPEIYQLLTLDTPVPLRDYRSVRKLLELAEGNIRLLSDAVNVYGLGSLKPGHDFSKAEVFMINFTKHYTWEFMHAGHVMIKVAYGVPNLPKGQLGEQKFRRDLGLTFPDLAEENAQKLWLLMHEVTKLRHGTIVVISEGAAEEAKRLEKQSFKVSPMAMAPSFIRQLTQIDGAMLLDTEGRCHAIGLILDGLASENGDAARGARYNSAIRYIETSSHNCLAVVVSEDGLINLIRKP
ncbi:DNA integrity scanning protein DisA nucleotide-binding domain protein [Adhaeribacter terreus]|uniref:DNA integrity scanning protein DisA nucleotide-binding domain protein n=1 Tax=Adhaeribacter terreus TaxID=529703 RepID=A0ABW0EFA1_9BACT